jgi:hypothetical protein
VLTQVNPKVVIKRGARLIASTSEAPHYRAQDD